jgi:hypothetical protein
MRRENRRIKPQMNTDNTDGKREEKNQAIDEHRQHR